MKEDEDTYMAVVESRRAIWGICPPRNFQNIAQQFFDICKNFQRI